MNASAYVRSSAHNLSTPPVTVRVPSRGEHFIALFEAVKGLLALLAGLGLLSLLHVDLQRFANAFVDHLHLSRDGRLSHLFIQFGSFAPRRLQMFFAVSIVYAAFRFTEAYGLCRARTWAKWVAVASGAAYLPFELHEVTRHASTINVAALGINLVIVGYMIFSLRRGSLTTSPSAAG